MNIFFDIFVCLRAGFYLIISLRILSTNEYLTDISAQISRVTSIIGLSSVLHKHIDLYENSARKTAMKYICYYVLNISV